MTTSGLLRCQPAIRSMLGPLSLLTDVNSLQSDHRRVQSSFTDQMCIRLYALTRFGPVSAVCTALALHCMCTDLNVCVVFVRPLPPEHCDTPNLRLLSGSDQLRRPAWEAAMKFILDATGNILNYLNQKKATECLSTFANNLFLHNRHRGPFRERFSHTHKNVPPQPNTRCCHASTVD